jgi:hypothetical protein
MRWVWFLLSCVMAAGITAMLWPSHDPGPNRVTMEDGASDEPAPPVIPPSGPTPPGAAKAQSPMAATSAKIGIDRQPDGSLRMDGRFTVTGSGSEQDPFVIGWPLLASAAETMDAGAGLVAPPPHIAFLSGQWVQISAFVAPPLWGERTSELLVMKNRWDGCCIGLPPTPFDCIEATLLEPIKLGAKHSISFGTIRGRLVVEPFAAGNFLIGLYRLESARLIAG